MTQAVKLALIDNSIDPDSYPPCAHWGEFLSVPFDSFRAGDGRLPDLGDGYTHLILTGSEASILERSGVFRSIPKYRSSGGGRELLRNFADRSPVRRALFEAGLKGEPRDSGLIKRITAVFMAARPLGRTA